ncbi:TPA: ead/Ea22-like family protein, partial [Shigella flexneri]|nr:ead/Ea22-like family protein [Shigella flexneri]
MLSTGDSQMSNIDKQALREVAEKATKGEWWSGVVDTD